LNKIQIREKDYYDKVYACWLGKNIGGTLGAPYETKKAVNNLDYYDPIPDKPAPNDDLDLQLIWLKMLEEIGNNPSLYHFAKYWKRYALAYPWNEYGFLRRNLMRGLMPPITGCFENYFLDEMGSPIRSEIWACISPGDPQLAASMAWKDSVLDHTGGEGMYGEMFWAAVESAAFIIKEPKVLIQIGLNMIPLHSAISRAVREALWCFENGLSWAEARERIVLYYGHNSPCHAKLCKAVNCGYDTDCTAATLGALLGILNGKNGIPEKWHSPIGEDIVLHLLTRKGGLENAPKTIKELTDRTYAIAKRFIEERSDVIMFGERTVLPKNVLSLLYRNIKALEILQFDLHASVSMAEDIEIILHYGGDPIIKPNIDKILGVSIKHNDALINADITLKGSAGWEIKPINDGMGQKHFLLRALEVQDSNTIEIYAKLPDGTRQAKFIILGNSTEGYPSGVNIPRPSFKGSDKEWLKKIGLSKKN